MEKNKKILIVEDERIIAKDIEVKLEYLGLAVSDIVGSGEDAISTALEKKPDLILMDINLEGEIDGIEAAEVIHRTSNIPVIYLTSYSDEDTLQRAKITNPLGYINKPFEEKELRTSIELAFYKYEIDRKLKLSEKKYRSLFENAQVGIIRSSFQDSRIIDVNSKFRELLAMDPDTDLTGNDLQSVFFEPEEYRNILNQLNEKGSVNQYEIRMKKGEDAFVWLEGSSWIRKDDNVVESVLMDISERKQIEEKLRQTQKMETVGQIAAGIAHEINTPLAVVSTRLQILQDDIEKLNQPSSVKQIDIINKNIYRISGIIEKLLGFSRLPADQKSSFNLNHVLNEVLLFVNTKSRKMGIDIDLELDENIPSISSFQNKLEQVFLNIVMNSIDAMPEGGRLLISTGIDQDPSGDERITVVFTDNGTGMSEETRNKIFEPFFTTKPTGKGTGLGMYISYGIIKELNGDILVRSAPRKGTEIKIILPMNQE